MLKTRRMTREEYTARRHALVMDVLYGMTYAEAACWGDSRSLP
jgi:hypothetical protein